MTDPESGEIVCSNCGITFKKYGRIPGGIDTSYGDTNAKKGNSFLVSA
jgi:hypothetical protein